MTVVAEPEGRTEDAGLVLSARSGDEIARGALSRRVGRSAYVFALQLSGDREGALDVAQESVIRFLGHLDRFDASRPIDPWLYRIVRNQVRDRARRERLRRHESLDLRREGGIEPASLDPGADPVGQLERAELERRIWACVSRLSDAHREIFVLRDFHQLSYREIAEVLGIPEGTVMSRLHASRTRLRALLAESDDPDDGVGVERSDR